MKIRLKPQKYSEIAFVEGIINKDPDLQKTFYLTCKRYFSEHYKSVFFAPDHERDDIFQNTYLTLWENIERGKIKVRNGVLLGREDAPMSCSLMTYMMSIAKLKYLELVRQGEKVSRFSDLQEKNAKLMQEPIEGIGAFSDEERVDKLEVISDCVAVMSERCRQILTLFYVDRKKLDEILLLLPTFTSKDALKTAKTKCLSKLKAASRDLLETRRDILK